MIQGTLCLDKPLKIKLIPSLLVGVFLGGGEGFVFHFCFVWGGLFVFLLKCLGSL